MITFIVVVFVAVAVAIVAHCTLHVAGGIKEHAEYTEPSNLMKFVISIVAYCVRLISRYAVPTIVVTLSAQSWR